ncbi:zinc finger BED domain-containing protein 4-like [Cydia splendana]|uniref:zinc finger BED domain-containing protein 4-like n=2 Tax=Cydia TaxID=82599 RepID=UPI002FE5AEAA
MPKVINPIWEYFEKKNSQPSKAECKLCRKTVSLGSLQPKLQTIKGLKLHLSKYHLTENEHFLIQIDDLKNQAAEKQNNLKSAGPVLLETDKKTQPTMQQLLANPPKAQWPHDHDITKRIDKAIMDYILVDMQPYNTVSGKGFKRLNFADPAGPKKYKLKSEKFFRTQLMPETFEKVKTKVVNLLCEAEWISFTTDIWSNPTKTCSLLSFTAHFVHNEQRPKVILGASVLENDHTGDYISEKLKEVVEDYNIGSKIHLALRDNAGNMARATRVAEYDSLGCVSHTLQLVIHDAILSVPNIITILKKCRKVVGHFHRSEQARRYLNTFQKTLNLPEHTLFQDVETRWNSTYLMLSRLIEQKNAINLYRVERGSINEINNEEWTTMQDAVSVLECFYEATLDMSSDASCVSLVIPLVAMLSGKLASTSGQSQFVASADTAMSADIENNESDALQNCAAAEMKSKLLCSLNHRFSFIRTSSPLICATLLDPRFKTKYLTENEVNGAKTKIFEVLQLGTPAGLGERQGGASTSVRSVNETSLWAAHDSIESDDDPMTDNSLESSLDNYLREPRLHRNANIYEYWHSSPYQLLRPAAKKFLSAPPTSVASEQLFSRAGQLYDERRHNLTGHNAEKLLFLCYNIELFNFDY